MDTPCNREPGSETAGVSLSETSVVIPAFNEVTGVGDTVRSIRKLYPGIEVIVVDDGSTDGTGQEAAEAGARLITHITNLGYGAALKTGIRFTERKYIVTFDADGEHGTEDIARLLAAIGNVDMVIGNRQGGTGYPLGRRPGKFILKKLADLLAGQVLPDFNCGLRAFRKCTIEKYLHLMPAGFSFSATSTFAFLKASRQVRWIPIETRPRSGKSTVRQVPHGTQVILLLLQLALLFAPLKVFLPCSAIMMAMAFGIMFYTILIGQGITDSAVMLFTGSLLVFFFGLMTDQISKSRREKFE